MQEALIKHRIEVNLERILGVKKIAIFPYGELGRSTMAVLEEYGIKPAYVVDNKVKMPGIIDFETFMHCYDKDTLILFTIEVRTIFFQLLEEMFSAGISAKNIVLMQMKPVVDYIVLKYEVESLRLASEIYTRRWEDFFEDRRPLLQNIKDVHEVDVREGSVIDCNCSIGDYTYIGRNCQITKAKIGRYASIGNHVFIGPGEHYHSKVSMNGGVYE